MSGGSAGLNHADDAARGAREDRVLAAKFGRRDKAAVGLHEKNARL